MSNYLVRWWGYERQRCCAAHLHSLLLLLTSSTLLSLSRIRLGAVRGSRRTGFQQKDGIQIPSR